MDKKIKKSIFARIKQWLLNIFGLSKKDEDSNTKPASNDAGQEGVDTPPTIAEKSAEEHTAPQSSNTEQTASEILERVKAIEEYLALGDELLKKFKFFDYSFVKDKMIRTTLESDLIEMWRCRLGVRGHKKEFNQFCLYVQMQAEILLGYYYTNKFTNENQRWSHIKKYSKTNREITKEDDITYSLKLWAFYNEFGGKYRIYSDILDTVRKLRNGFVHIESRFELSQDLIKSVYTYASEKSIRLFNFCGTEYSTIHNEASNEEFMKISGNRSVSDFNNGIKLKCVRECKPYDTIVDELKKLCNAIQSELKNVR